MVVNISYSRTCSRGALLLLLALLLIRHNLNHFGLDLQSKFMLPKDPRLFLRVSSGN